MKPLADRQTLFSPCRTYRYILWRDWGDLINQNKSFLQVIGLNPSTADETKDDPTIRRCIRFARDWGFSALCMTNLFAFRATDPNDMMSAPDPVGPENWNVIDKTTFSADLILLAWGSHGDYLQMGHTVLQHLQSNPSASSKIRHLGFCKNGEPRHPLYIPANTMPSAFQSK